ncbi:MAG: hypothetical protein FP814_04220 [Desulfobacterium sp.]|nr:hypothetical protein [Desulfobacterium sp.]MBU3948768.1 hypothetical protein [Pseudomonadota bacterium]MBU4009295.1 hypothetical protein [Pseudomonadota bacterium]MBU4035592.1 hypothetical protein [Pseudomonadota bacterium]
MTEDYGVHLTSEEETRVDEICKKIRKRVASEQITPRERFEAVYRGETPDRIPIQVCAIGLHAASNYGVTTSDLYSDPKIALFAYLTHLERFGYDTLSAFRFSAGEKEFGAKMVYSDHGVPFVNESILDTAADLGKVKIPDVRKDGTLPWQLWMLGILKKKLGDIMPIFGFMPIPGAIGPVIMPMDKQFLALRKDPVLAHCVAALVMKFTIDYGTAMFEAGADMIYIVGVDDQVSYAMHRQFEFPYVCGLVKSLPCPCFIIGAGDWSHVLESYAEAGVQGFFLHSGQPTPLEKAKEVAMSHKLTLRYGISNNLLVHGPVDKIRNEVKRLIQQGWPGGRFVLATDGLDINTPAEHLDVFVEAAKEYGKFPLKI